jgi:hypothetical protein
MPRISAAEVIAAQRAYLRYLNAHRLHAVHAASLRAPDGSGRQARPDKQEPPEVAATEGSTDSNTSTGGVKWSLERV